MLPEFLVEITNAHPRKKVRKKSIESLARRVMKGEQALLSELNVVFVNDREIKRLNKKYLSHDYVTDVLSFRLDNSALIEGEVYVNLDQADRQAREFRIRPPSEVGRLVAHGILHIIGYEDDTPGKRRVMQALEDKYLKWKNR